MKINKQHTGLFKLLFFNNFIKVNSNKNDMKNKKSQKFLLMIIFIVLLTLLREWNDFILGLTGGA